MASDGDSLQLCEKVANLNVSENKLNGNANDTQKDNLEYGLPLVDVYKLAFNFYREKEGKAFHFSYEDKLQLVAFSQQVLHGPLADVIHKLPPLGTLDVVGKDRRLAWQKLGKLSGDQARAGFIELLSRRCPLFAAYVEAHRREKKEKERKLKEEEEQKQIRDEEEEKFKKEQEEKLKQEHVEKEEMIKRQIQQALNEQTYVQFKEYAEQQCPEDPNAQAVLIKELQNQHYIQYMQQLQAAQLSAKGIDERSFNEEDRDQNKDEWDDSNDERESNKTPKDLQQCIVPASMWTRSDINEFKLSVSQSEGNGVVRVGHGETVTVRVPTHPNGSRIFWEFATDSYDIGFGVYFEFGIPTTDKVSVHVTESDEEDPDELEDDVDDDDETIRTGDLEAGSLTLNGLSRPLLTQVIPVYRRDCQTEVYAGSHEYPGQGIYLLKFDNSYSLWRSKTLYYRVYYTQ